MNAREMKTRSWKTIASVVPVVGIVLATAIVAAPTAVVGQTGNECIDDAAARHAECIEKRRTWVGERICDATLIARVASCLAERLADREQL